MLVYSLLKYFYYWIYDVIVFIKLTSKFKSISIAIPSKVNISNYKNVTFGKNVIIGAFSEVVVLNDPLNKNEISFLSIGDNVTVGSHANIRASGGAIIVGDDALLAQGVSLIAANHVIGGSALYRNSKWDTSRVGIEIGRNVWIGANVVILPGVHVGDNSIIAAGSIVTTSVPGNQIWGGVPARLLKVIS